MIASVSGGANSLWLTEWVTSSLDLTPGMRVLDLGCGRAASSIFLRRELGWRYGRPICGSARRRTAAASATPASTTACSQSTPTPTRFRSPQSSSTRSWRIDSFPYYGTDDLYLGYLASFLKPGGVLAIAGSGLTRDQRGRFPTTWPRSGPTSWCLHSAEWWRRHWERTGLVRVEVADTMTDGWQEWLRWQKTIAPDNETEIRALEADRGRTLGYVRVIGRRRPDVAASERIVSVPSQYSKAPLLRDG